MTFLSYQLVFYEKCYNHTPTMYSIACNFSCLMYLKPLLPFSETYVTFHIQTMYIYIVTKISCFDFEVEVGFANRGMFEDTNNYVNKVKHVLVRHKQIRNIWRHGVVFQNELEGNQHSNIATALCRTVSKHLFNLLKYKITSCEYAKLLFLKVMIK